MPDYGRPRWAGALIPALLVLGLGTAARGQGAPPRVLKIEPENGAVDVSSKLKEIRITFSEPMTDKNWSVCGAGEHFLDIRNIRYTKNCTVLVIKVKLKPGWSYGFGLNSPSFRNFKSKNGVPLEPVWVTFTTKGRGKKSAKKKLPNLGKIDFALEDARGFRVRDEDYAGVPLFLAFGAAW